MNARWSTAKPVFAAAGATASDVLDMSDVWLTPANGRVVFDERGNSKWQWPSQDDPFDPQPALGKMNANDLRVMEPGEIRRSELPWLHESERPAQEFIPKYVAPSFEPIPGVRTRGKRSR